MCNIIECGRKTITSRTLIVNGEEVQEQEYPWVVAIYDSNDEQICGGTIISREFVISGKIENEHQVYLSYFKI